MPCVAAPIHGNAGSNEVWDMPIFGDNLLLRKRSHGVMERLPELVDGRVKHVKSIDGVTDIVRQPVTIEICFDEVNDIVGHDPFDDSQIDSNHVFVFVSCPSRHDGDATTKHP